MKVLPTLSQPHHQILGAMPLLFIGTSTCSTNEPEIKFGTFLSAVQLLSLRPGSSIDYLL